MGGLDLSGIGSVADLISKGIDKIWPNKNDPAYISAQAQLLQAQQTGALKQMDDEFQLAIEQAKTNAVDAAKPGLQFRDGAGWICVFSLAVMIIKSPIEWGCALAGHPVVLPAVDTSVSMTMLTGLLGLGGMHMYQQTKS